MRINTLLNRKVIRKVAAALHELNDQVIYVGGAVVSLYVNDPAADDVRPTKDVDISLSVATIGELERIRGDLVRKGFTQTAEDRVICRFRYGDILVDVMNTKALGWAPSDPWFAPGFAVREIAQVEGENIQILPLAYFLASKFSAYNERGNHEPRTSHDIEDIVYLLDNRTDIAESIINAPDDVRPFLKNECLAMLSVSAKQEAIYGNLLFENRDARFKMITGKLRRILDSI